MPPTPSIPDPIDAGAPTGHIPVLLAEVLDLTRIGEARVYADATTGLGGHAAAAAARMPVGSTVVLNDADASVLPAAVARVEAVAPGRTVVPVHGNFAELPRNLVERGVAADVVVADLGFSSMQVDVAARGFSFMRDGPLDMRFDPSKGTSAAELLASISAAELAGILWEFGEERRARAVADRIVARGAVRPISTTGELASVVSEVLGGRGGGPRIHPATRTFQALRIAVNDELGCLRSFLESVGRAAAHLRLGGAPGAGWLRAGARVAVITFHSLEDRLVKTAFKDIEARGLALPATRRPVEATGAELESNPRARSAKLRVIELTKI